MSGSNLLRIQPPPGTPEANNPLAPDWLRNLGSSAADWMQQQHYKSQAMGLEDPATGLPTGAGIKNALRQYTGALVAGSGIMRGGAGHFELDPYDLKPADNLSVAEQAAVDHYANGSAYLNADNPAADKIRAHLDDAIDKSRLSDNARLYRGFSMDRADVENIQPGDKVTLSPGYVSTSTSKDIARRFADDDLGGDTSVLAELRVPRGHPALHIPTAEVPAAELGGGQNEILLPRNTQFHVHAMTEKSDGRYEMLASPVADAMQ